MANKQGTYHASEKVKLEAVRRIIEDNRPVAEIARELNLHRDTVNRWVIAYRNKGEEGLGSSRSRSQSSNPSDKKRIKELEDKVRKQDLEIDILKKFQAFLKKSE